MSWFWLPFGVAVLFALFGLFGLSLWVHELILDVRLLREQRLWRERTGLLFQLALAGCFFTFTGLYIYPFFLPFLGAQLLQDIRFLVLAWYGVIVLVLTLPFWALTIYLRVQSVRQVQYCYQLPQDADQVREHQCVSGMHMAVLGLSRGMEEEFDSLVRALIVSSRAEVFADGKRGRFLLTNNFAVYCDLAVQASVQGYHYMLQLARENRSLYEELVPLLSAFPEMDAAGRQRLHQVAQQITSGSGTPDVPGEETV